MSVLVGAGHGTQAGAERPSNRSSIKSLLLCLLGVLGQERG